MATLPRAGTVEVIQEFGGAAATPARPILAPVIIGSAFQIESQKFSGYYEGRTQVLDELVGTGNGVETDYQLDETPVLTDTVSLHVGSITGDELVVDTDYSVNEDGEIALTATGVAALATNTLHAAYYYAPDQIFIFPEILQGATIDSPGVDVSVYLRTPEDIYDVTNGYGVIVGENTVTVPGNLSPTKSVTALNGQMDIQAVTDTIEDTSVDFFGLGVRPGDTLSFIVNPAELERIDSIVCSDAGARTILTIPTANSLTFDPEIAAQGGKVEYSIARVGTQFGDILISYKARRADKEGVLLSYEGIEDVEDEYGEDSIVPENPLPYGIAKCLGATDQVVSAMMVPDQDSITDHQKALEILEGEEVYMLVPLTNNQAIHQVYLQHCDNMSDPLEMHERRTLATFKAENRTVYQDQLNTGSMNIGSKVFTDTSAQFVVNGTKVGSVIKLLSPDAIELANVDRTELIITGVTSDTQVTVIQDVTKGTEYEDIFVDTGTGAKVNFQLPATENVVTSSVIIYVDDVQVPSNEVTATEDGEITLLNPPGLDAVVTADYEISTIEGIQYTVESQELTNSEISNNVAAVGSGYSNRRICVVFAETAVADDESEVEPYFINCSIAGLVSTLPPNQPIANLPIPGFTRIKHIRRFSESNFGTMAAGGVVVLIQDRDTSPIVMRNWITTDMTNVNTRECSIVDMADYYAKFLRRNLGLIAGRFNITESFIDDMLRPSINGVIREMITAGFIGSRSVITSIEQSTVNKDHLFVEQDLELFAPANRITVTVRII